MLLTAGNGTILGANERAAVLFGTSSASLEGRALAELCLDEEVTLRDFLRRASRTTHPVIGVLRPRVNGDSHSLRAEGAVVRSRTEDSPSLLLIRLRARETTVSAFTELRLKIDDLTTEVLWRKRAEAVLTGQKETLESILQGADLRDTLTILVRSIESSSPTDLAASILLLDPDGIHLRHGAAPSLPDEYNHAIDGIEIGPSVGSCGTAAFRGEAVIVEDIQTDPLWSDFRGIAGAHGLNACWSTPIISTAGRVLGTVALYYRKSRKPGRTEFEMVDLFVRTAQVAIEAKSKEDERAALLERERVARLDAETASRLKDEFLATVSHELRTPLTSILGWTSLLQASATNDEVRSGLETIERSARAQAQLVEDLLDVSRISSGKIRVATEQVDLRNVVTEAVEAIRPAADGKRIELRVVVEDDLPVVIGDAQRLHQVVWNLLTNAIKFTPEGGRVEVSAGGETNGVRIVVRDTGKGIPAAFLPRIFDRFSQFDGSVTRVHGGLGLGLSIVRSLVELHGGTVRAESAGEGKGAAFTIALPGRPGAARDNRTGRTDEERAVSLGALDGLRVLVVEDDGPTRGLLVAVLGRAGADVKAVSTANEALAYLAEDRPDVIVSDIAMPDRDGLTMIREIRTSDATRSIPALAISAHARREDQDAALAAGFQLHVVKPFEPDGLVAAVSSLRGRSAVAC